MNIEEIRKRRINEILSINPYTDRFVTPSDEEFAKDLMLFSPQVAIFILTERAEARVRNPKIDLMPRIKLLEATLPELGDELSRGYASLPPEDFPALTEKVMWDCIKRQKEAEKANG